MQYGITPISRDWLPGPRAIVAVTLEKPSHVKWLIAIVVLALISLVSCGDSKPQARVFFSEPADGATVKSPVKVSMMVEGLVVEPASEEASYMDGHGHHHIIVDALLPSLNEPIPVESIQHLHYGKAQSTSLIELKPGKHTLRLLFAKGDHVPWNPVITDTIEIFVVD